MAGSGKKGTSTTAMDSTGLGYKVEAWAGLGTHYGSLISELSREGRAAYLFDTHREHLATLG